MITVVEEDHIIPNSAEAAFMRAYFQALESGRSVLKVEKGIIFEIFPDGSRRKIKEINQPIPVPSKTKRIVRNEQKNTTITNVCRCKRVRQKYIEIRSHRYCITWHLYQP